MSLLILVEDEIIESYEILARKQLGLQRPDRSQIRAQKINTNEVDSVDGWSGLVNSAIEEGRNCIVVVVDEEDASRSLDRPRKLQEIKQAFSNWCESVSSSSPDDSQRNILVSLVISKTCLECWLLADVQAVVSFASGGRRIRYRPNQSGRTNHSTPHQAKNEITQIIRNVNRERNSRRKRKYEKSSAPDICTFINLDRANNNSSLLYFLHQVHCQTSGCINRQSD
ncbi:MAG: hypothetical protein JXA42_11820 [Anaerolineales bacterium]|nr:hypothetical protein [Anaerolineales bacterium]